MDDYNTESKDDDASILKSPNFKSLMASAIPSIMMRPIYQPLEILKIRFQLQHQNLTHQINYTTIEKGEAYKSMLHAVQLIHAEEGLRGLFKGLGFAVFANTSSTIIQFAIFRKLRKELHKTNLVKSNKWCDFVAGFSTGAAVAVLMNPLDCVRTHLLARESADFKSAFSIAHHIYKDGGFVYFYNGALAAFWHAGALNGLRFMFYNIGCNYAMKYEGVSSHKNLNFLELFVAGFGAGLAANIFSYPIEFIKRRLILDKTQHKDEGGKNKNRCRALVGCISSVLRNEGPMAFYKGFVPNAMKSIISTTIQLSCYDMIYHTIGDWFS